VTISITRSLTSRHPFYLKPNKKYKQRETRQPLALSFRAELASSYRQHHSRNAYPLLPAEEKEAKTRPR
jgi:hypothetical protein